MTKKECFLKVIDVIGGIDGMADCVDILNKEIDAINKKNDYTKARRAKNNAANDELSDLIANAVGNDFVTIPDIAAAVGCDSTSKVGYRCRSLAEDGILEKGSTKVGKSTLVTYRHI